MATKDSTGDMGSKTEREQIAQRFREFMAKIDRTGKNLARAVGISDTSISRYLNGHQVPDSLVLGKISELTDLNINWLLTGRGEPIKQKDGNNIILTGIKPQVDVPVSQHDRRRCHHLRQFIDSVSASPGARMAIQEMLGLSCLDGLGTALIRQFVSSCARVKNDK